MTPFLAKFNDFFYRKSLSLFDWTGMLVLCGLGADNWIWYLMLIPFFFLSARLTDRFTLKD